MSVRNPQTGLNVSLQPVVRPAGYVEYVRNRWWRWTADGLMDLITPRQHGRCFRWDRSHRANYIECAAAGCYICRNILKETNCA